jgi:plastocyanin
MTQHVRSFALRCIIALSCIATSFGTQVTGRVTLVARTTRAGTNVVVYAESLSDPHVAPKPGHYEWEQRNKTFVPHLLAIPVGSTVTFPNEDPIFHNVFSLSRPQPFDLGLYRAGASKVRVFSEPGTYRIFCNIHPQMTGLLLVVPTSWIAYTDASGGYKLDLPSGRYRLTAWSEHSEPATAEIAVESGPVVAPPMALDDSKFVQIRHKNKYGQDYPAAAYDPNTR